MRDRKMLKIIIAVFSTVVVVTGGFFLFALQTLNHRIANDLEKHYQDNLTNRPIVPVSSETNIPVAQQASVQWQWVIIAIIISAVIYYIVVNQSKWIGKIKKSISALYNK